MINGQRQRWRLQNKKGWSRVCRHQVPGSHQCWAPGRAWPAPRPRPGVLTCTLEGSACLLSDELAGAGLGGPSFAGGGWGGADGHRGSIHTGPEPHSGRAETEHFKVEEDPRPLGFPKKATWSKWSRKKDLLVSRGCPAAKWGRKPAGGPRPSWTDWPAPEAP